MMDKKNFCDSAARAGIVLGGVSVVYFVLNLLIGKITGAPLVQSLLQIVIWIAKFVGCIVLMNLLMKRFASREKVSGRGGTFAFGCAAALLSAFFYSVVYYAYVKVFDPELFRAAIDSAIAAYSSHMDSNSTAALEQIIPKLPGITFFVNLFYCTLYGVVLSAIFSSRLRDERL